MATHQAPHLNLQNRELTILAEPINGVTVSTPVLKNHNGTGRTVHHWGRVWLGKRSQPFASQPSRYVWIPDPDPIEVSVQTYGQPRWMESLQIDMVEVSRELLEDASTEYDSVRIQVPLFTHLEDGSNAKFTLQHVERRPIIPE